MFKPVVLCIALVQIQLISAYNETSTQSPSPKTLMPVPVEEILLSENSALRKLLPPGCKNPKFVAPPIDYESYAKHVEMYTKWYELWRKWNAYHHANKSDVAKNHTTYVSKDEKKIEEDNNSTLAPCHISHKDFDEVFNGTKGYYSKTNKTTKNGLLDIIKHAVQTGGFNIFINPSYHINAHENNQKCPHAGGDKPGKPCCHKHSGKYDHKNNSKLGNRFQFSDDTEGAFDDEVEDQPNDGEILRSSSSDCQALCSNIINEINVLENHIKQIEEMLKSDKDNEKIGDISHDDIKLNKTDVDLVIRLIKKLIIKAKGQCNLTNTEPQIHNSTKLTLPSNVPEIRIANEHTTKIPDVKLDSTSAPLISLLSVPTTATPDIKVPTTSSPPVNVRTGIASTLNEETTKHSDLNTTEIPLITIRTAEMPGDNKHITSTPASLNDRNLAELSEEDKQNIKNIFNGTNPDDSGDEVKIDLRDESNDPCYAKCLGGKSVKDDEEISRLFQLLGLGLLDMGHLLLNRNTNCPILPQDYNNRTRLYNYPRGKP